MLHPSTRPLHGLLRTNGMGQHHKKPFVLSLSKHGRFFIIIFRVIDFIALTPAHVLSFPVK